MFSQRKFLFRLIYITVFYLVFMQMPLTVSGQGNKPYLPKMGICTPKPYTPVEINIPIKDFVLAKKLLDAEVKTASEAESEFPDPYPFQSAYRKAKNVQSKKSIKNPNMVIMTDRDTQIIATALHCLANINLDKGRYAKAEQLFKVSIVMIEDSNKLTDLPTYQKDYAKLLRKTGRQSEAESLEVKVNHLSPK